MYFFSYSDRNNLTYSVDMLRLKTNISANIFRELEFRFDTCWKNYVAKKYNSGRVLQFFYNYVIEVEEGHTFWFGFLHNTENRKPDIVDETYNFTVEFNPNKIKKHPILMYILSLSGDWCIKRYDLAVDIPLSIIDIIFDKSKKREYKVFSQGYSDKTYYLGHSGLHNAVKIYNKKNESNLNIQGELTRIEITKEVDDFPVKDIKFFNVDKYFPVIYTNSYLYSLSDYNDKTLFALTYAVQNGFPFLTYYSSLSVYSIPFFSYL